MLRVHGGTNGRPSTSSSSGVAAFNKSAVEKTDVVVCITSYNEDQSELIQTLQSIHNQLKPLQHTDKCVDSQVSVCVVLDGWVNASSSMNEFIGQIMDSCVLETYGETSDESTQLLTSEDVISTLNKFCAHPPKEEESFLTCILTPNEKSGNLPDFCKNVTFIIKIDNRSKLNSHEWFLRAFAPVHAKPSSLLLFTDAGAVFRAGCLMTLMSFLQHNRGKYCATQGFKMPCIPRYNNIVDNFVYLGEFYHGYCAKNFAVASAYATIGFQPVISGPCQMVTAEACFNPAFQKQYFDDADTSITGGDDFLMVTKNLVEDRIFTNALTHCSGKKIAHLQFSFYESEAHGSYIGNPDAYVSQRKRWLVGIVSYLSQHNFRDFPWKDTKLPKADAVKVYLFEMWYLSHRAVTFVVPSLVYTSLNQNAADSSKNSTTVLSAMYLLAYCIFTLAHFGRHKLIKPLYYACLLITAVASWKLFSELVFNPLHRAARISISALMMYPGVITAAKGDLDVATRCFLGIVPYFFVRHGYALIYAYTAATSQNVNWGTRPGSEDNAAARQAKFGRIGWLCTLGYIFTNLILVSIFEKLENLNLLPNLTVVAVLAIMSHVQFMPLGAAGFAWRQVKKMTFKVKY